MAIMPLSRQENKRDLDRERGSNENPWTEIAGTVRKVDEDKVKDCTDDIDTLLVFAGLYSAVLTAFLIESYKNLFADESESLLRQMVHQTASYRFTNGYLNSTFDPSQLPTFKAAVSDIRVNVCWFASLILSLASASFGIAVKQWLREFLSMDYISPQERLRIRDARIHGLRDWKLFQIAAFLPILLQISLVLFFVGLCFFTAAVHPSIGITSLFLVSCWAFFFFMSVLAPLFSPRCPYKTTILKVPFRYARPHIRAFLGLAYRQPRAPSHTTAPTAGEQTEALHSDFDAEDRSTNATESVRSRPSISPPSPLGAAWLRLRMAFENVSQWIRATGATTAMSERPGPPNPNSEDVLVASPRSTFSPLTAILGHMPRRVRVRRNARAESASPGSEDRGEFKELQYDDDCMDLGILSELLSDVTDQDTFPEEEDVIRSTNRNDLIIFRNIDCDFFDDSLLARLPGALNQRPPPLRDVLQFVKTIVHHRIRSSLSAYKVAPTSKQQEPWPWTLSHSARSALADILAKTMEYELHHGSKNWRALAERDSEWSRSFILLISFVSSHEVLPNSVMSLFSWGNEHYWDVSDDCNFFDLFSYQMRTLARSHPEWPARSLLFLAQSLGTLKAEDAVGRLEEVTYNTFIVPLLPSQDDTYRRLLARNPDDGDGAVIAPTPQRIVALLEVARVILHNYTTEQTQGRTVFYKEIGFLLEFVFEVCSKVKGVPNGTFDKPFTGASDGLGLYRVLKNLFTTPQTTGQLLRFFATYPHFISLPSQSGNTSFFLELIRQDAYTSRENCIMVLAACSEFFAAQAKSVSAGSVCVSSSATLLRLCLLIYQFSTLEDQDSVVCWKQLCAAIYQCHMQIRQRERHINPRCRYVGPDEEHADTCKMAYIILNYRERWIIDYMFTDEMIDCLRTFVCPSHTLNEFGFKLLLIRRLEQAETEQGQNAVADLKTSSDEARTGDPAAPTLGDAAVATRGSSSDNRPHGEQSASPGEDSVTGDPLATEVVPLIATMSPSPQTPDQGAALSSKFGVHDLGIHVIEPPRSVVFGCTTDTEPQGHFDPETIDGASGLHSVSIRRASPSGSLTIHKDPSSVDAPDDIQAVDSLATLLSTPPTEADPAPAITVDADIFSAPDLRLPAVISPSDGAPGSDAPKPLNEDTVLLATSTPRDIDPTGSKDAAVAESDASDGVGNGRDVAGLSKEGSGLQVDALPESSELPPAVLTVVHSSAGDAFGVSDGNGAHSELAAIEKSREEVGDLGLS